MKYIDPKHKNILNTNTNQKYNCKNRSFIYNEYLHPILRICLKVHLQYTIYNLQIKFSISLLDISLSSIKFL